MSNKDLDHAVSVYEDAFSEMREDKWGHPILPKPAEDRASGVRGRAPRAPGRAGEDADVGARGEPTRAHRVRRARQRGQGRHDPADARAPQPEVRPPRRAPGADRRRARAVVLPALRRATADPRGGRVLRSVLVQPLGCGAGHGLRERRADRALLRAGRAVRGVPRRGRHPSLQALVVDLAGRAGPAPRRPAGRPVEAVEAQPDGRKGARAVGGLHGRADRHVAPHRQRARALVLREQQREAGRSPQRDPPRARRSALRREGQGRRSAAATGDRRAGASRRHRARRQGREREEGEEGAERKKAKRTKHKKTGKAAKS